ncbi:MAG TPA: PAS domain-containing protein [Dongiaceae bacterium]|nr:PAS domain-containing protein [Dongiaceae bacterium]
MSERTAGESPKGNITDRAGRAASAESTGTTALGLIVCGVVLATIAVCATLAIWLGYDRALYEASRHLALVATAERETVGDAIVADEMQHWRLQSIGYVVVAVLVAAIILGVVGILLRRIAGHAHALRTQRDFLDRILDTAGAPVLVSEAGGRVMRANAALDAMLGRDGGAAGEEFLAGIADREWIDTLLKAGRPADYPRRDEVTLSNRFGQRRRVRWVTSVLEQAGDEVVSTVSIGTDVTGERRSENELRRQTTMLRQAHRIAKLCYWQWQPRSDRRLEESDGVYTYTDDTEELFGHSADALAAAGADYWSMVVHPDDREMARARFTQFLRDSAAVHVQEYRILHPKLGERYIRECGEKSFDAEGRMIDFAGTLQDVTDARRAQQALRENEAKLRRGFRMAKLGHWSFEPNRPRADGGFGVYTYSDQVVEMYGLRGEQLDAAGDRFYETYIHPDDRDELRQLNERFLVDDRASYTHEYRFMRPDGRLAYIRESAEKIRNEAGRVIQVIGTVQDVTDQRLADIALRESEAKLKQGFRIAKMGHWAYDPSHSTGDAAAIQYAWSEEAAEIFGVPVRTLDQSGAAFYDRYVHRDDRDDLKKLDREFLAGDLPGYTQEYRIVRPDGSVRHILESAEKRLDRGGRVVQVNGIVQDVTGLRRSALSMRRVERQLRRAYRLARLGYWYWEAETGEGELDEASRISDEVCEIFGVTREELHWDDIQAFCARYVYPEDREMVARVFTDFDAGKMDHYTITYRFLHPGGEVHSVRSVSERIRDEHGRPLYGIGIIQDFTQIKAAEETLLRSEYQLRRAQRVAKLYCWHTEEGPQGQTRMVFDHEFYADVLRHEPQEAVLSPSNYVERFVHPDDRARLLPITGAFEREEIDTYSIEYRLLREDGSIVYIRSAAERMRDADGRAAQMFGAIQDVTDLHQRERELTEAKNEAEFANRSKSDFLANMSHELRTPLNAIIGFSQVIRDQLFGTDQTRYVDYARDIHESGRLLLELINDILDMSKLEAGKQVLYEETLSLDQVVEDCRKIIAARASEVAVKLAAADLSGLPKVWGEERALKQILLNLLSNAVKFTPRGGSVRVEGMMTQEGELCLVVRDTGIGIAPDMLPHLFLPFHQGDNSTSRRYGGTGLGLAITRRLVELHGGRIAIESEVGQGTVVRVFMPPERLILDSKPADDPARIAV